MSVNEINQTIGQLQEKNRELKSYNEIDAHDILMNEYLKVGQPEYYRSKMPGYEKTYELVTVNTKMAKKIIKTRLTTNDGVSSIGGASGITSMLSRGRLSTKPMSVKEQKNSIERLYYDNHYMQHMVRPETIVAQELEAR